MAVRALAIAQHCLKSDIGRTIAKHRLKVIDIPRLLLTQISCKPAAIILRFAKMQQTKLEKIEEFINEVLREELKQLELCINKYNGEIMEYVQLKNTVQTFVEHMPDGYKTQMNIGSNVFMQARVKQMDKILINLGKDVYLEMDLQEAERFCDFKVKILTKESDVLREASIKKRAQIKMALIAISEQSNMLGTNANEDGR